MAKLGGAISLKDPITSKIVPDEVSECAFGINKKTGEPCSSELTVRKMKQFTGSQHNSPTLILEEAKKTTNCPTERCVLESPDFRKTAGEQLIRKELSDNFKIVGPTDVTLLNNENIDTNLKQWERRFSKDKINKFFAYNFNMRNFKEVGDTLATIDIKDLYDKGYRTFGCVINTDLYSGKGIHWMALFGDMRSGGQNQTQWTVEFFNSSGNPPQAEFAEWLTTTKSRMSDIISEYNLNASAESVIVSRKQHQYSKSECGVYALYYIYARLNSVPWTYFRDNHIPDTLCFELRQHLFHDPRRPFMQEFDYELFEKTANPKWEPDAPKSKLAKFIDQAKNGKSSTSVSEASQVRGGGQPEMPNFNLHHENVSKGKFLIYLNILSSLKTDMDVIYVGRETEYIIRLQKMLKVKFEIFSDIPDWKSTRSKKPKSKGGILILICDLQPEYMTKQKTFIEKVRPVISVVNFYPTDEYLCGDIYIIPWNSDKPQSILLITSDDANSICDYTDFEDKIMFHHRFVRFWKTYKLGGQLSQLVPSYDECYDCYSEYLCIRKYVKNYLGKDGKDLIYYTAEIMNDLDSNLIPPHGIYKNLEPMEKFKKLLVNYGTFVKNDSLVESEKVKLGGRQQTTHIYLIRHAQTDNNARGVIQGTIVDPEINSTGIKQAKATGKLLKDIKIDAIYSSPMKRCVQTINIIADENPSAPLDVIKCDELRDLCMGDLEGLSYETAEKILKDKYGISLQEIRKSDNMSLKDLDIENRCESRSDGHQIESYTEYYNRLNNAIRDIIADNIGKTILICTHARLSLFKDSLSGDYYDEKPVENASYSHVEYFGDKTQLYDPDMYKISEWNIT